MNSNKSRSDQQAKLALDTRDVIPEPIDRLMETFRGELSDVRFPDVSLDVLEAAASAVRKRATELEGLRQQIVVAEASLHEDRAALTMLAERGLAYAKVYAAGQPKLAASLGEIRLGDAPARKERKPRKSMGKLKTESDDEVRSAGEGIHLVAVG